MQIQFKAFMATLSHYFKLWFHKRNIIVVSEHKVLHIPISGRVQFCLLAALTFGVCWASYSTGSFMAARTALKEQSRTLRQVTNARIDTGFGNVLPTSNESAPAAGAAPTAEPLFTLSALEKDKVASKIAVLEHKIMELKDANTAIVHRLEEKTADHIEELQAIIRQTGLKPDELSKQAESKSKLLNRGHDAAGGPFIPDEPGMTAQEYSLYDDLDSLSVLRQVVGGLPLAWPMENAEEQSPFGHRIDPINGHLAFHSGLDMSGPVGTKIHSPANGTVIFTGWNGSYGNCIDIDHGLGITTRYGHLSQILVKEGQTVATGAVIAIQGSTGRSTGPHLHYEVRYHNVPMNPENFLTVGENVLKN